MATVTPEAGNPESPFVPFHRTIKNAHKLIVLNRFSLFFVVFITQ